MPSEQDIDNQRQQLGLYRENVRTLLRQIARQGGEASAPLAMLNGLQDARALIAKCKAVLCAWGEAVEDLPGDTGPDGPSSAGASSYTAHGKRTGWEETLFLLASLDGDISIARQLVHIFLAQPLEAARLLLEDVDQPDPMLLDEIRNTAIGGDEHLYCSAHIRNVPIDRFYHLGFRVVWAPRSLV